MRIFRLRYIKNGISLFTGLIFLNMSFFLAEVAALKLDKDKKVIANIAKLISSSSTEEEKDAFGGSADEDPTAKEVNLMFGHLIYALNSCAELSKNKRTVFNQGLPLLGSYEIYSPPPEV